MKYDLGTRIWSTYGAQRRKGRIWTRAAVVGVIAIGAAGVMLWPKPAIALEDVIKATQTFSSVQWKQLDEGIIHDVGGVGDPKRVPWFSKRTSHYVAPNDHEVQVKLPGFEQWRGMQCTPGADGKTQQIRYTQGASTHVTDEDVVYALSEFKFFEGFSKSDAASFGTSFEGRPVVGFDLSHGTAYGTYKVTFYADPATKRMVYFQLEILGRERERLLLRMISDIVYDGPLPTAGQG